MPYLIQRGLNNPGHQKTTLALENINLDYPDFFPQRIIGKLKTVPSLDTKMYNYFLLVKYLLFRLVVFSFTQVSVRPGHRVRRIVGM